MRALAFFSSWRTWRLGVLGATPVDPGDLSDEAVGGAGGRFENGKQQPQRQQQEASRRRRGGGLGERQGGVQQVRPVRQTPTPAAATRGAGLCDPADIPSDRRWQLVAARAMMLSLGPPFGRDKVIVDGKPEVVAPLHRLAFHLPGVTD